MLKTLVITALVLFGAASVAMAHGKVHGHHHHVHAVHHHSHK